MSGASNYRRMKQYVAITAQQIEAAMLPDEIAGLKWQPILEQPRLAFATLGVAGATDDRLPMNVTEAAIIMLKGLWPEANVNDVQLENQIKMMRSRLAFALDRFGFAPVAEILASLADDLYQGRITGPEGFSAEDMVHFALFKAGRVLMKYLSDHGGSNTPDDPDDPSMPPSA